MGLSGRTEVGRDATAVMPSSASRTAADDTATALRVPPLHGFRQDVQALRGLAVLLVVLYHAQVVAPGGFVGVDVFFVISGFVVGRRLVARMASPAAGVMTWFYVRRARRILPALAVTLAIVILVSPLLAPLGGVSETSPTGVAAALFSANFYLYQTSGVGYFAPTASSNPLLHTWSLSVEEQFYFVIPLLLLVAWRLGTHRMQSLTRARVLVGAMIASSLALCVFLTYSSGTVWRVDGTRFAFFSPFTRAWEFAVGLALVLLPVRALASPRLRPVLVASGIAMIGVAGLTFTESMAFPGIAAALPVAGTALVIFACTRDTAPSGGGDAAGVLRPMTWMGDLSYSWYLWHWPLIVFAAAFWPEAGVFPLVVAGALSLVPAWLSYRWLEHRFRAAPSSRTRATVALAACCIVVPLAAAVIARPVRSVVEEKAEDTYSALLALNAGPGDTLYACDGLEPYAARDRGRCSWGSPRSPSVVLIGDSNAAQFDDAFVPAARTADAHLQIATLRGCPVTEVDFDLKPGETGETTPSQCHAFMEGSLDALVADPPDVVVLAASTDQWVYRDKITIIDPTTQDPASDTATEAELYEDSLVAIIDRLRSAGSRVVLLDVIPKPYTWDFRDCSNLAVIVDASRCLPDVFAVNVHPEPRAANALHARAAERAGAQTWSFQEQICPDRRCASERGGELVWSDPGHISRTTAKRLAPFVAERLQRAIDSTVGRA